MSQALSFQLDLLHELSWPRLMVIAVSLVLGYYAERRFSWRMFTLAVLISQVADALALCIGAQGPALDIAGWWIVFGIVPFVAVRPELRRAVLNAPRQATMLLPRFVEWLSSRRRPSDGALKHRQALRLLRAEGWRPGAVQTTVTDADGRTHTVWAPPQRLPLGMRMHGWLAFAPTVALAGIVLWLLAVTPPWARVPIAAAGVGVGVLGHLGLLNPLHWLGL